MCIRLRKYTRTGSYSTRKTLCFYTKELISLNFSNIQTWRGVLVWLEKNRKTLLLPQYFAGLWWPLRNQGWGQGPQPSLQIRQPWKHNPLMATEPSHGSRPVDTPLAWLRMSAQLNVRQTHQTLRHVSAWACCLSCFHGPTSSVNFTWLESQKSTHTHCSWKDATECESPLPGKFSIFRVDALLLTLTSQITLRKCLWHKGDSSPEEQLVTKSHLAFEYFYIIPSASWTALLGNGNNQTKWLL